LLTVQDQSIRQSYLEKGELHFSRLTPLQNSSLSGIAQTFAGEARQAAAVPRQPAPDRPPAGDHGLPVRARRPWRRSRAAVSTANALSFTILDLEECARAADSRRPGRQPLRNDVSATAQASTAAQPVRQRATSAMAITSGQSASHCTPSVPWHMSGCLLWAGKAVLRSAPDQPGSGRSSAPRPRSRTVVREIVEDLPADPDQQRNLRQVINRYLELEKGSTSPVSLWREISSALQSAAAAEIDGIDWQVSTAPATPPIGNSAAMGSEPPPVSRETAIVHGTLRLGQDSNPRQVLAVFRRLLEALRRNPGLQIEVLQQPFDVESGKSLKGGDAALEGQQPRSFTVEIRRLIE
jgi:hypothetical protein